MRPVCARDGREMKIVHTGEHYEEVLSNGRPYKIWAADRYQCPECPAVVLIRSDGQLPMAEHYQENYDEKRMRLAPTIQVRA